MGSPRFADLDRLCILAVETLAQHGGNKTRAAASLDWDRCTLRDRVARYHRLDLGKKYGDLVPEGMEIKERTTALDADGNVRGETVKTRTQRPDEKFEVPDGHEVRGVSAFLDSDGKVIGQWIKTKAEGPDPEAVIRSYEMAAEQLAIRNPHAEAQSVVAQPTLPLSEIAETDLLNLHPLPDLHLGLQVEGAAGREEWSLEIAVEKIKSLMVRLIQRAPHAQRGVILGGGDLLEADDDTRRTRRSGHPLKVSADYDRVLSEAEMLLVFQTELALQKYPEVVVHILRGNHDDDSAVAVAHFLRAWFRQEPRVTVICDSPAFFVMEWGKVLLGATHGHETKIADLKDVLTADHHEEWGRTIYRYGHGFHIHHATKSGSEKGGFAWETHQTPIPAGDYAFNGGMRAGRSMQVITYSRLLGERGRSIEPV